MEVPSTRPYLIRALHEWCVDNGYTPYISVAVNGETRVPSSFVKDDQITLNISGEATQHLAIDNEAINFAARFGGRPMNIHVPIEQVLAIYARENGVGMAFPVADGAEEREAAASADAEVNERDIGNADQEGADAPAPPAPEAPSRGRAKLKRIK